jgi:hypothetical protein
MLKGIETVAGQLAYIRRLGTDCAKDAALLMNTHCNTSILWVINVPGQRFYCPGVGFGDGWITQRLERAVLAGKGPIVLRQEVSQLFHFQFLLLFVWVSRLKVHGERLIVAGQQVGQLLKECLFHGQFLHFLVI